ncbi:MAG: hypothetical protein AAGB93_06780 [Planctomycetota bacterium]
MKIVTALTLPSLGLLVLPTSAAAQSCSQSLDPNTIAPLNSIACLGNAGHQEYSCLRRYSPGTDCGVAGDLTVSDVRFGIEGAASGTGSQPAEIRIYQLAPGAAFTYANMGTPLNVTSLDIFDATDTFETVTLTSPVTVSAPNDLVVELFLFDGEAQGNVFFLGSNAAGETAPSYVASSGCGTPDPVTTASVGFPNCHFILDLESNVGPIGVNYCTAAPNSTGSAAVMSAMGSAVAATNDVTLTASGLPQNAFGYFLTSSMQGFVMMPGGSAGNLCLSGAVGRYVGPGQIQDSGAAGEISLTLDLAQTPTPTGFVSVMAGETRNYQAWFRDSVGGTATSNLSDGLQVDFL